MTDAGRRTFSRGEWAALGAGVPPRTVPQSDTAPIPPDEVADIYVPLAELIELALARHPGATFLFGVTGSVAVGKSATARAVEAVLRAGPGRPSVDVLSTDAFLFPNRVLDARGLTERKGFPDTYDWEQLGTALSALRSGAPEVSVPVYSHRRYDIVPGGLQRIARPDVLLIEGLIVLQDPPGELPASVAGVADQLDGSLYVDAAEADLARWFRQRVLAMREGTGAGQSDFARWLGSLSLAETLDVADHAWTTINLVNLRRHVAPTRDRASVVLTKGADHRVGQVELAPR